MSAHPGPELHTERLLLRRWREEDLASFAALNSDPEVMRFFPRPLGTQESAALAQAWDYCFDENGFGIWAVELSDSGLFIGGVGLAPVRPPIPCAPAVETGWRLMKQHWGCGYATEAARAAVRFGFERCGLDEIVSLTAAINVRSRAVMARLGMTRDVTDDFDHPRLDESSPLRRHVLYRLRREHFHDPPPK